MRLKVNPRSLPGLVHKPSEDAYRDEGGFGREERSVVDWGGQQEERVGIWDGGE